MLTELQIDNLLSEGRRGRNYVKLLQARAAIIEQADGLVQVAADASRGFTDDEQARVRGLLERAADVQQEATVIRADFAKDVRRAHPLASANRF